MIGANLVLSLIDKVPRVAFNFSDRYQEPNIALSSSTKF